MRRLTSCARSSRSTSASLALTPELGGLAESVRYALEGGGKRVRPVLCLATAEAAGAEPGAALPAAAALELVHTFSLVHDDLPALDDDELRRGRAEHAGRSTARRSAILAGDALLAEAFRLALSYPTPAVARELVAGDARDDRRPVPRHHRTARRPGRAAPAEDGLPLLGLGRAARSGSPRCPSASRRRGARSRDELGLLFQIVDDILDEDGYVREHGAEGARALADEAAERAQARLAEMPADTSVLERDRRGPRGANLLRRAMARLTNDNAELVPRTSFDGPGAAVRLPGPRDRRRRVRRGPDRLHGLLLPGQRRRLDRRARRLAGRQRRRLRLRRRDLPRRRLALRARGGCGSRGASTWPGTSTATGWMEIPIVAGAIIYDWGPRDERRLPGQGARPGGAAVGAARASSRSARAEPGAPRPSGSCSPTRSASRPARAAAFRQLGETKVAVFTVVNAIGAIVDREGDGRPGPLRRGERTAARARARASRSGWPTDDRSARRPGTRR